VPRCTVDLHLPDPDPAVVAIDTVTSDLVFTDPADVTPYEQLYARLRDAALPQAETLDLLTKAAAHLPDTDG
jgi:hypothetical protein